MLKRCFFQLHWLVGVSVGLVLALMGLTGAVYCFEEELIQYFDAPITTVNPGGRHLLAPADLLAHVRSKSPYVSSLSLTNKASDAARVGFMSPIAGSDRKKFDLQYLDPYSGELLGKPASENFFRTVLNLHRKLALDNIGKAVTGASTLGMVFLILSGVYLRWTQIKHSSWRTWLVVSGKENGRGFLVQLHAIFGTWLFLIYLLVALTGLTWSYEWVRNGLARVTSLVDVSKLPPLKSQLKINSSLEKSNLVSSPETGEKPDIALVWKTFEAKVPEYQKLIMLLPSSPMQSVQILYLTPSAAHPYANNRIVINGMNGEVEKHELYADKTAGEKIVASLYAIHSGHFFGLTGRLIMALASLLLPFFAITGWMMYLQRRSARPH